MDLGMLASGGPAPVNGMGNLADELADAFSDSNEDEYDEYLENNSHPKSDDSQSTRVEWAGNNAGCVESAPSIGGGTDVNAALLLPHGRGHQRKNTDYDGSEYGSESDLDSAGMPPTLLAKIDAIESLTRRGTEKYGGPGDEVFQRVTDGLRDLGPQSSLEGNASR
jgi:hypothetical protein